MLFAWSKKYWNTLSDWLLDEADKMLALTVKGSYEGKEIWPVLSWFN